MKSENKYYKNPKYKPITNPRRNKKHCKSCLDSPRLISDGRGHRAKPSSDVTENYSPLPLPSSMEAVGVRVSQFAHSNINTKTIKQQSDCGGSVI